MKARTPLLFLGWCATSWLIPMRSGILWVSQSRAYRFYCGTSGRLDGLGGIDRGTVNTQFFSEFVAIEDSREVV